MQKPFGRKHFIVKTDLKNKWLICAYDKSICCCREVHLFILVFKTLEIYSSFLEQIVKKKKSQMCGCGFIDCNKHTLWQMMLM